MNYKRALSGQVLQMLELVGAILFIQQMLELLLQISRQLKSKKVAAESFRLVEDDSKAMRMLRINKVRRSQQCLEYS